MDAASSSKRRYGVFLSFRGEDTRKSFTAHLYQELSTKGIYTFIDDDELRRGEVISPALVRAIENSMISVIVLSENYATSRWCLEELVKILECMKTRGQTVLPIFYNVDPSDVRNQRGKFGEALAGLEEKSNENKKRVEVWRDTLREVANLSGWDSRDRYEPMLIQEIVKDISNRLFHISSCEAKNLVGIESSLQEIEPLLQLESIDEVRMVGICGMGGIGKTTFAKAVYERISGQFEACAFLENVGDDLQKLRLHGLKEKLLSQLLEDRNLKVKVHSSIRARLFFKKVLIVIDDVTSQEVLEELVGKHDWFGQGSRIIVTSRDKHFLDSHGLDEVYEVQKLNYYDALELLSHYAFKTVYPPEDYMGLVQIVIAYTQGLPLAVKVLGSLLYGKDKPKWESEVAKLRRIPNMEVQSVLQVSFDALDEKEKNLFLDIACFFKGEDKDYAMKILDSCGFFPDIGISVLIDKSLVTILDDKLMMHNLLQEMGREIVRRESPKEPGKRSRLWFQEDVYHVLTKETGTEEVEAMFLDLSNLEEIHFTAGAFAQMNRLRFLKVKSRDPRDEVCTSQKEECKVQYSRDFQFHYDDLRYLYWHGYPLRSLSFDFNPKDLVDLSLPYSNVKQLWKGVKILDNLKFMDLSNSKQLIETPDFSRITNLERLVLEDCTHLHKIHPSLGGLSKLNFFSLRNCINLRHFPSNGKLESLQILILSGCSKLEKFPEIQGYMEHLLKLYLDGTAINELPSSIEYANGLVLLDLKNCKKFTRFPTCIHNLKSLETLNISGGLESEDFQESFWNLEWFKKLYTNGIAIRGMPSSISLFRKLGVLSFSGSSLPCRSSLSIDFLSLSALCSLQHLDLSHCNLSEEADISELGCLSSLRKLNLSGNNFISLPSNMLNRLSQLTKLDLHHCRKLQALLELPSNLQSIDAHNCTSLEIIPDQSIYKWLYQSSFVNCFKLMGYQSNLETLFLTVAMDVTEADVYLPLSLPVPFSTILPGSVIPDWIRHQSPESEVSIDLSPNWFSSNFLGFALSAVIDFNCVRHHANNSEPGFKICVSLISKYGTVFCHDALYHHSHGDGLIEPDHVWLAYAPVSSSIEWHEVNHIHASFLVIAYMPPVITRCGVGLMYSREEDVNEDSQEIIEHSSPLFQSSTLLLQEIEEGEPSASGFSNQDSESSDYYTDEGES